MCSRDKLRETARLSKLPEDWDRYKKARNLCVKEINRVKNLSVSQIFEKLKN